MKQALVIGAGPAGLMAAEQLALAGLDVIVADAMPSAGRKFLMAGKSGLNLTKNEPPQEFRAAYGETASALSSALSEFGPQNVMDWATALGQDIFTGSTGRVFPTAMKASPLLRAWLARLRGQGVTFHNRWRWTGWNGDGVVFSTPDGEVVLRPAVTVLALGGASWSRLGSDGKWAALFDDIAPFRPANMGFDVDWSKYMAPFFGKPLKGVSLTAGDVFSRGEFIISQRGIEGGGIYEVSAAIREGAALRVDLLPDIPEDVLFERIAEKRPKLSLTNFLRSGLKLSAVKVALFHEQAKRSSVSEPDEIARLLKDLPIPVSGHLPLDEAISTAGGIRFRQLDDNLMLIHRPGTFCAGEMLDWEAPTGGYLITGCLATGLVAGVGAARFAKR